MSVYAVFEDASQIQVASNTGWSEVGDYIDALDVGPYGEIIHLWEHAWTNDPPLVARQIRAAVSATPPNDDVAHSLGELALFADGRSKGDVLAITSAPGPVADEAEEDD